MTAAVLGLWAVALASSAAASVVTTTVSFSYTGAAQAFGEPSDFRTCPVTFLSELTGTPGGGLCANTETTGGQITIGKATVQVANNPDTVDFGAYSAANAPANNHAIVLPSNGQMFGGPAQAVPGGLLNLPPSGPTSVSASLELAAPATPGAVLDPTATTYFYNPFNAITYGTALQVPVKVQLNNATLGPSCTIGSNSDPILLSLSPTAASNPTLSIFDAGNALTVTGLVLGDSTFAAPSASGCGPAGALDRAVDSELGVPAPVGRNDATLDVNADEASTCYAEGTC